MRGERIFFKGAFYLFVLCLSLGASGVAEEVPSRRSSLVGGWFSTVQIPIRVESVQLCFYSYKPQLRQFTTLLNGLGSPGIDPALLTSLTILFSHTEVLASRLELAYWSNVLDIPPPNASSLSAELVPLAFQLIYRPAMLYDRIPLYLGLGVGYSHLSVSGSALDLIEQQGFSVDQRNSGWTGFALVGLEFALPDTPLIITFEAQHVLKTFVGGDDPSLDFEFDGTALGMGLGLQF